MKHTIESQPENILPDPMKRRGFLEAATFLGLGTMAIGLLLMILATAPVHSVISSNAFSYTRPVIQ